MGKSAPSQPDPRETARVAGETNVKTAVAQKGLGSDNTYTPDGQTTFGEIGKWSDGTPRFESRTTLSPEQQLIYDISNQNEAKLGGLAGTQIDRVGDLLGTPLNINNEETEARLMELGRKRLDPLWQDKERALQTNLFNRGIRESSDPESAWQSNWRTFGQGENDAYNSLLLSGRQQAVNEALTERNQPINEITALMSGSQVSQPTPAPGVQPGVAPVDYTGLVNNNYNAAMQGYGARKGAMGSAAGALGTAAGGWLRSDRRAKKDITRIGDDPRGWGIYRFKYIGDDLERVGFMADEVEKIRPDAVATDADGLQMVNYAALR